jgi:NAD-dependent DNA ligase
VILYFSNISTPSYFFEDIEIRGEVYMKQSVFNSLNKLGNQFFNPRNAASGELRQFDEKIISFVI